MQTVEGFLSAFLASNIGRLIAPSLVAAIEAASREAAPVEQQLSENTALTFHSLPRRSSFRTALLKSLGAGLSDVEVGKIFGISRSRANAARNQQGPDFQELVEQNPLKSSRERLATSEVEHTLTWLKDILPVASGSRTGAHVQTLTDSALYERYRQDFHLFLSVIIEEFDDDAGTRGRRDSGSKARTRTSLTTDVEPSRESVPRQNA